MLSPYRIQPNITIKRTKKASDRNFGNNSHPEDVVKRPPVTSNELVKRTTNKGNKNNLKRGSVQENVEINDKYLNEILHENNP